MNPGLKRIRTGRSAKGRSYLAVDLSAQVGLARANSLSALTDDSGSSAARASQLSFEHLSDHFAPPSGSSGEQVRSPHRLPPISPHLLNCVDVQATALLMTSAVFMSVYSWTCGCREHFGLRQC